MWLSRLEAANRSNAQSRQQHHALPAFTRALVAPPRALELARPEGVRLHAAFFESPQFRRDCRLLAVSRHRRSAECPLRAIDRDRGASRDATPPTPPGIRVRTTAVRSS